MGRFHLPEIAILIVGVDFGHHSPSEPVEKLSDAVLGHYTDPTMWYLAAGAAAAIGELLLVPVGLRAQR